MADNSYLTLTEFVPGTKAKADEVNANFSALKNVAQVSGVRAYDMALRLFHDGVQFENSRIETDISKALAEFLKGENPQKKIFATYTAMLEIRKEISKITDVEKIL